MGDSSSVWCQVCVWLKDLGKGSAPDPECVFVFVSVYEAVIILACTAGSSEALLRHATLLHSIYSHQNKNTLGYTRPARHHQVTNSPRHNAI